VAALSRSGITEAFPIQAATIADALAGRDVLGKARTGSGKTLAFGLPSLARLADAGRPEPRRPLAVILVPTRELAMQVNDSLEPYAHALQVSLRLVAGGLSMSKQIFALERGVHLLVATPGRLADLVRRGHADLTRVQITVLDEADHMAQMGFMEEIDEILEFTPQDGQRLLFSATLDGDVKNLIDKWMHDPVTHDVTGGDAPATMEHIALNIPPHVKYQLATRIANRQGRTIAFVRTKLAADRIAEDMRANGVLAVALHGDKPQNERTAAITGFRAGQIPVLVATDVAARGIHVDHVDLVLQIDPPADPKDYTHRAGRTARAGDSGLVVTLVLPHQRRSTDRMFETAGITPKFRKVHGEDPDSLDLVDKLTGASEPSRIPVPAPRLRGERPQRGRPERGRPERGRPDRGPRGDRARGPRPESRDRYETFETAPALDARASELSRKEAELAARERALAEREARLAALESGAQDAGSHRRAAERRDDDLDPHTARKAPTGARTERKPKWDAAKKKAAKKAATGKGASAKGAYAGGAKGAAKGGAKGGAKGTGKPVGGKGTGKGGNGAKHTGGRPAAGGVKPRKPRHK